MCTTQDTQIGEGRLCDKMLTWMIPERIVTVAATITFCSSIDVSLVIVLFAIVESAVLSVGVNLTTTAPTIILRTGNGPNKERVNCSHYASPLHSCLSTKM